MPKSRVLLIFLLLFAACNSNLVFSEYQANSGGIWSKEDVKEFIFTEEDTISRFNLFINIRNDNQYPFSNLFLITDLNFPDGTVVRDTLEYEMALPDGKWLGKGYGSLKENKLWYKENIVFPLRGVYTLKVAHAMRQNGTVEGVTELEGITDVGFQIETID
ncbi:gliding motility lipoprotein GldH [Lentiprolixibacter aurantiacus]|uniref:Gliding motility lipoprotein GldH n=1 Tax=Lentiprolixibacter aurantiacus TaxID=2993939 RepID=A0AAE3MJ23_9FLAO|nr:gliding motility lipoprotein GldH [Lentiprolixibacter aurantiacus]MCX2718610.1 gliding motility lipoprotein GldH [Lentiprolixibacter aurantiacus]